MWYDVAMSSWGKLHNDTNNSVARGIVLSCLFYSEKTLKNKDNFDHCIL